MIILIAGFADAEAHAAAELGHDPLVDQSLVLIPAAWLELPFQVVLGEVLGQLGDCLLPGLLLLDRDRIGATRDVSGVLEGKLARRLPAPLCHLTTFGDLSGRFRLAVLDLRPGGQRGRRQERCPPALSLDALKENGIEIPYPQRDVHV